MKKVAILIAAASLTLGISTHANANMSDYTEKQLVSVCNALKNDNQLQLRLLMKHSGFTYQGLVEGLKCNGESALDFAMQHGSSDTMNLLAKRARVNIDEMLAKR